ncbi:MAG TPA: histidine kinase [Pedococcus sp.]|nr:histidine kinase [Pedococcus sp.]
MGTAGRSKAVAAFLLGLNVAAAVTLLVVLVGTPAERTGDVAQRAAVASFSLGVLVLACVGYLVISRNRNRQVIGWLLLAVGVLGVGSRAVIALAIQAGGENAVLAWSTNWVWVPAGIAPLLLILRFPTGQVPSPRWHLVERAVVLWGAIALVVTALVPGPLAVTPLERDNPLGIESAPWLEDLLTPLFMALPVLTVLCAASLLVRFVRAGDEVRQQLKWVAAVVAALALVAPLAVASDTGALLEATAYLLLPAGVGVAVMRHRLYDLGLVVRRTVVYAAASAVLLGLYVTGVAGAQRLLRGTGLAPDLVATALVAVAAVPVLSLVQRALERLLFGERRDPDTVMARLGDLLSSTPETLLPQVVEQIAKSLRLPYVAIRLVDGTRPAETGEPRLPLHEVPLEHSGEVVGWLLAAPRTGGDKLGGRDVVLLERVASQAGLAVRNSLLTAELTRAAERLQLARAQERSRLQRDLHDELGPALGAIAMRAEAARTLLADGDAGKVDEVLSDIERGAEVAVADVRRIIAEIHPRVLEERGLREALLELTNSLPQRTTVTADLDELLPLPPAVELAAYRVAAEALRNAARHADACLVRVTLHVAEGRLRLCVEDDGVGVGEDVVVGVGLVSMRTRARELGGTLSVAPREGGGTAVSLDVPIGATT